MEKNVIMIRVRFAPSPTGTLHLGNARTAILNWLFARHFGGKFILRIEDTDIERSKKEYEIQLINTLIWLGLDWDEKYRQSERLEIYRNYAKKLLEEGRAYYCYCTPEELEAERKFCQSRGLPPRYSGKCRFLTETQKRRFEIEGRKPTIRFLVPEGEAIEFLDLLKGKMRFLTDEIGDFIIMRSTGIPAYNFAVVIDDALMEITHVIRGEDHLSNTACQLLLYKTLNFNPPQFGHHPLLLAPDRTKLSKRHGAVSVEDYKEKGFLPEALFFYLTTLGGTKEILTKKELIVHFDLKKLGRSNAIFDVKSLLAINRAFIRNLPLDTLLKYTKPFLPKANSQLLKTVIEIVRENIGTLRDIEIYWPIFTELEINLDNEAKKFLKQEEIRKIIQLFYENMEISNENFEIILSKVVEKTGLKIGKLLLPLRVALTGRKEGPELKKILSFLPKEWIKFRLKRALEIS